MLGIVIGVAAVIATAAIGSGAKQHSAADRKYREQHHYRSPGESD
jgi:hypothetical protein